MKISQDIKLNELSKKIFDLLDNGINYSVYLQFRVCSNITENCNLNDLYEAAVLDGLAWRHNSIPPTSSEFIENDDIEAIRVDLFSQISNEGDKGAGPLLSKDNLDNIVKVLLPAIWIRIDEILDISNVTVYKVEVPDSDEFFMILAGCCYFIRSFTRNSGILIYFTASD